GVGDQDVDRAELVRHLGGQIVHGRGIGDIADEGVRLAAAAGNLRRYSGGLLPLNVDDRHPAPGLGEAAGGRGADAAARAGDQHEGAVEIDTAHAAAAVPVGWRRRAIILSPYRGRRVSVASGSTGWPGRRS